MSELVEKSRSRGRPRAYDPNLALDRAAELFWTKGFADSSLDHLSAAMTMGRPSIYAAFGNKEALFLKALERYRDTVASGPLRAMEPAESIRDAFDAFFRHNVEYMTADPSHLGCLIASVAPVTDAPAVHRFLNANVAWLEGHLADRLADAKRSGELPEHYSPVLGARRAISAVFSISSRARLGTSREELLADATDATTIVLQAGS